MRQETITYFCDRCGKEMIYHRRITDVHYNGDTAIDGRELDVDLCDDCYAALNIFLVPSAEEGYIQEAVCEGTEGHNES